MKIVVMGGENNANLKPHFARYLEAPGDTLIYPETFAGLLHPLNAFNYMKKATTEHIESDKSLYCLTYSEHILNGIRVAIRQYKGDVDAKAIQIKNNGEIVEATIFGSGQLSTWIPGVWDTYDVALLELLQ